MPDSRVLKIFSKDFFLGFTYTQGVLKYVIVSIWKEHKMDIICFCIIAKKRQYTVHHMNLSVHLQGLCEIF